MIHLLVLILVSVFSLHRYSMRKFRGSVSHIPTSKNVAYEPITHQKQTKGGGGGGRGGGGGGWRGGKGELEAVKYEVLLRPPPSFLPSSAQVGTGDYDIPSVSEKGGKQRGKGDHEPVKYAVVPPPPPSSPPPSSPPPSVQVGTGDYDVPLVPEKGGKQRGKGDLDPIKYAVVPPPPPSSPPPSSPPPSAQVGTGDYDVPSVPEKGGKQGGKGDLEPVKYAVVSPPPPPSSPPPSSPPPYPPASAQVGTGDYDVVSVPEKGSKQAGKGELEPVKYEVVPPPPSFPPPSSPPPYPPPSAQVGTGDYDLPSVSERRSKQGGKVELESVKYAVVLPPPPPSSPPLFSPPPPPSAQVGTGDDNMPRVSSPHKPVQPLPSNEGTKGGDKRGRKGKLERVKYEVVPRHPPPPSSPPSAQVSTRDYDVPSVRSPHKYTPLPVQPLASNEGAEGGGKQGGKGELEPVKYDVVPPPSSSPPPSPSLPSTQVGTGDYDVLSVPDRGGKQGGKGKLEPVKYEVVSPPPPSAQVGTGDYDFPSISERREKQGGKGELESVKYVIVPPPPPPSSPPPSSPPPLSAQVGTGDYDMPSVSSPHKPVQPLPSNGETEGGDRRGRKGKLERVKYEVVPRHPPPPSCPPSAQVSTRDYDVPSVRSPHKYTPLPVQPLASNEGTEGGGKQGGKGELEPVKYDVVPPPPPSPSLPSTQVGTGYYDVLSVTDRGAKQGGKGKLEPVKYEVVSPPPPSAQVGTGGYDVPSVPSLYKYIPLPVQPLASNGKAEGWGKGEEADKRM